MGLRFRNPFRRSSVAPKRKSFKVIPKVYPNQPPTEPLYVVTNEYDPLLATNVILGSKSHKRLYIGIAVVVALIVILLVVLAATGNLVKLEVEEEE